MYDVVVYVLAAIAIIVTGTTIGVDMWREARKRTPVTMRDLPPEQQWRIDYSRNELVSGGPMPRRLPIQPGESPADAILRHGIAAPNTSYQALGEK